MGANQRQAEVALRAYLDRGRMVLEQLEDGQWEDVETLLKWRDAAFYEFRAADHIEALDASQDERIWGLWLEVEEVNKHLERALANTLDGLGHQLAKRIDYRKKLAKFHSGMDRD